MWPDRKKRWGIRKTEQIRKGGEKGIKEINKGGRKIALFYCKASARLDSVLLAFAAFPSDLSHG